MFTTVAFSTILTIASFGRVGFTRLGCPSSICQPFLSAQAVRSSFFIFSSLFCLRVMLPAGSFDADQRRQLGSHLSENGGRCLASKANGTRLGIDATQVTIQHLARNRQPLRKHRACSEATQTRGDWAHNGEATGA